MKSFEIRKKIMEWHKNKGYEIKPSVPMSNPAFPYTFNASAAEIYMKEIIERLKRDPTDKFLTIQPCYRRVDIDNIKLNGYTSLFEMVGKIWFTPDFNKEKEFLLKETLDFFINELSLDKNKIWITIFGDGKIAEIGETTMPLDNETRKAWKKLGIPKDKIVEVKNKGRNIDNFLVRFDREWEKYAGYGTDIFYDLGQDFAKNNKDNKPNMIKGGRFIELATIWMLDKWRISRSGEPVNLVESRFKNFAIGFSVERLAFVSQKVKHILEIDNIKPFLGKVSIYVPKNLRYNICDLLRAIFFIMSEGNDVGRKGKDYDIRLLFRKLFSSLEGSLIKKHKPLFDSLIKNNQKNMRKEVFSKISQEELELLEKSYKIFLDCYAEVYPSLSDYLSKIIETYKQEKNLFYENLYQKLINS